MVTVVSVFSSSVRIRGLERLVASLLANFERVPDFARDGIDAISSDVSNGKIDKIH